MYAGGIGQRGKDARLRKEPRGISRCCRGAEEQLTVVYIGGRFPRDLSWKLDRFGRTSEERSAVSRFGSCYLCAIQYRLTIEDECRFDADRQPRVDGALNQRSELIILAPESPRQPGLMEEYVDESVVGYVSRLRLRNGKSDLTTNRRRQAPSHP